MERHHQGNSFIGLGTWVGYKLIKPLIMCCIIKQYFCTICNFVKLTDTQIADVLCPFISQHTSGLQCHHILDLKLWNLAVLSFCLCQHNSELIGYLYWKVWGFSLIHKLWNVVILGSEIQICWVERSYTYNKIFYVHLELEPILML